MVLTFHSPGLRLLQGAAKWTPAVITWVVMLAVAAALAWVYLSNPKEGPYGTCYQGRGRPIPCELKKPR